MKALEPKCCICGIRVQKRTERIAANITQYGFECRYCKHLTPRKKRELRGN